MLYAVILVFVVCFGNICFSQETIAVLQDSTETPVEIELEKQQKEIKIFLEKIEIMGRIETPQTVFKLPGQDRIVDDIRIDRSFFKEIFRSVEKDKLADSAKKLSIKIDYW